MQYHRSQLNGTFFRVVAKMLLEWPAKTLSVPFGLVRLAVLHPSGAANLLAAGGSTVGTPASGSADDGSLSVESLLRHTAKVLRERVSSVVEASALLALVNLFAIRDPTRTRELCAALAAPACLRHLREVVSIARTNGATVTATASDHDGGDNDDRTVLADHCWSMCINLTLLLERWVQHRRDGTSSSSSGSSSSSSGSLEALLDQTVVEQARAVGQALLPGLVQSAVGAEEVDGGSDNGGSSGSGTGYSAAAPAAGEQGKQQAKRDCQLLANLANTGIIDSHAEGFWHALERTVTEAFAGTALSEDAQCLLRHRGPVYEAF
jgi:hypothetical protein